MLKIEVLPNSTRTITSKKTGQPYRVQEVYATTLDRDGKPQPHPQRAEFFLNDADPVPGPGFYLLAPQSIYVDRQGRFAVAPKLVPVGSK